SWMYAGGNKWDKVGWYWDKSGGHVHFIGKKISNDLGLYDMSGNLWEWCLDTYDSDFYAQFARDSTLYNPINENYEYRRVVLRGGSWDYLHNLSRVAGRDRYYVNLRDYAFGFRLARNLP
ncbi:MAG: SUMF1/EgtB/PvdO family nonheme iron enzyme, partial [Bacteroidota bacterium]